MASGLTAATDFFNFTIPSLSPPFSIACWVYAPSSSSGFVVRIFNGSNYHGIVYLTTTAIARSFVLGDGTFRQATISGFGFGSWQHLVGVFSATNNRQIYLNGTAGSANTNNQGVGGVTLASTNPAPSSHDIADLSIWNVALTQADITSLAKGFSGSRIRENALLFHAPLVRSRQEMKTGVVLTDTGTPTAQPHPPIIGAIAA
jgi:hypothetical protein